MSTLKPGKRFAIAAAGAVMLLSSSLPAFARESPTKEPIGRPAVRQDATACARITKLAETIQGRLDTGRQKLMERRDDRAAKLAARRADEQAKVAERRAAWEGHWNDLIGRLEKDGATNTAAIAAFKTSMEAAWKTRDAAIAAADKTFRDGLDALVAAKKTAVESAAQAYKSAASAAFTKAQADCAAGVAPATVLTTLRASLKTAQDTFKSDRQAIDKIGEKVKALVTARQAAIQKANADFKAAADAARTAVKATYDIKKNVK
jgi:hypothetical protein